MEGHVTQILTSGQLWLSVSLSVVPATHKSLLTWVLYTTHFFCAAMVQYLIAVWDYAAEGEFELSFRQGDRIKLLEKHNDDWWEGTLTLFSLHSQPTYISLSSPR